MNNNNVTTPNTRFVTYLTSAFVLVLLFGTANAWSSGGGGGGGSGGVASLYLTNTTWSGNANTTISLSSSMQFTVHNTKSSVPYNVVVTANYPSNTQLTGTNSFSFQITPTSSTASIGMSVYPTSNTHAVFSFGGHNDLIYTPSGNVFGPWNFTLTVTQAANSLNTTSGNTPTVHILPLGTTLPSNFSTIYHGDVYNGLLQASATNTAITYVVGESKPVFPPINVTVKGGDDAAFVGYWTWNAPNATSITSTTPNILPTIGCVKSSDNGIPAYMNMSLTSVLANSISLSIFGSCPSAPSTDYTISTAPSNTFGTWNMVGHIFESGGSTSWPYDEQDVAFTGVYNGYYYINVPMYNSTTANLTLNVLPHLRAPAITESTNSLPTGNTITFTATVSGGESPYSYNFMVYNNATNTLVESSGPTISTYTYSPASTGNYYANVVVTDNLDFSNSSTKVNFSVFQGLGFGTPQITIPNSVLTVGQNEIITANVMGGVLPYNSFAWTLNGNALTTTNTPSITFNGNASTLGTDNLQVVVTDSAGQTATGTGTVTVANGMSFGTPNINIPNSTIAVGQNEIITANVMGGVLPYNSFEWFLNGNALTTTNTPSITFNGNASTLGTDALKVVVTDNALNTATGTGTVTVVSGLSFGTPQITIPNSVLTVGQNEIITANVLGGVLPYNSFAWTLNGNALVTTNTPSITFNGNYSTLGTDNVMVTVTDNAGNTAIGSGTVDVINGLSFGQPQIDIPSSILMVGQNEIITANAMGGTLPYNSFAWTLNGNALTTTNTPSITFNGNVSTLGTDNIEVTVTDNALKTALGSAIVRVVNATAITLTPASKSVTSGDSVTYNVTITGGVGPFNVELYNVTGSKQQGSNFTIATPGGSNTITFTTNPTGTFTYNAIATDQVTHYMFASANAVLTVNTKPSTGGGGGGGGGSGGIPGGGGSLVPTVKTSGNCTTITNFTQHNQESFTLNKQAFTIVENYINPTSAGVSVNGKSYLLDPNVPQTVLNTSSGRFNITLTDISYLPIIDTIKVEVCYSQNQPKQSSGSGNPMVVSLTTNKTISVQNGPVLLTGSITNGTTGPYTYNFIVTNSTGHVVFNNVSVTNNTSNSTVFTPTLPGIYTAAVHITTGGTIANSNPKSLTVSALQSTTTTVATTTVAPTTAPPASVNNWWIYLIVLLIVIVLLLMYYYMRKRSKAGMSKGKKG